MHNIWFYEDQAVHLKNTEQQCIETFPKESMFCYGCRSVMVLLARVKGGTAQRHICQLTAEVLWKTLC